MNHDKVKAFVLLLFCVALPACGIIETTSVPTPAPTLTPTWIQQSEAAAKAEDIFKVAEECARQWESTQEPDDSLCAIQHYRKAIDLSNDRDQQLYYQFRLDRLSWLSGQKGIQERERILDFIRHDLDNEEAAEFFFGKVLPKPQQIDVGATFVIYRDGWETSYLAIAQSGMQLEVSETCVPGNVYAGSSSLEVEWNKNASTWASLIIGFDPRIADADLARAGALHSLDLDRSSKNDYRLEFAARGDPRMNDWEECIIRIKLQDQNLIVREPIGNQLVYHIQLAKEWRTYSIPLEWFVPDQWILAPYVDETRTEFESYPWLEFDWTRIKQINFDIPYFASGDGSLFLDNIQIVRNDLTNNGVNSCVKR